MTLLLEKKKKDHVTLCKSNAVLTTEIACQSRHKKIKIKKKIKKKTKHFSMWISFGLNSGQAGEDLGRVMLSKAESSQNSSVMIWDPGSKHLPTFKSCKFDLHVLSPMFGTCHVYSTLIHFTKQVACNPTTTCDANKTQYVSKVGLNGCPTKLMFPQELCGHFISLFLLYFSTWLTLCNSSLLRKLNRCSPNNWLHWHKTKMVPTVFVWC